MILDDPLKMVRTLKGAPLSCLFVLHLVNQPVTGKFLCRHTGYSDHSITDALALLEDYRLATCDTHRSNWRLTNGARQLPLMPGLLEPEIPDREKRDPKSATTATTAIEESGAAEGAALNRDREKCDSDRENRDPTVQALRAVGIGEPTASRLAVMEHVTPEYVHAHAIKARTDKISTSLLIHRIRSADPIPTNHDPDCESSRRHYVTGKYAEYINH
jgi:hypothetical protein